MIAQEAKKIVKEHLIAHNLPYTKLTAKTISFSDLARGSSVFVKIHGWQPNPCWDELDRLAKQNGFRVET